jgi:hypothetical protein
MIFKFSKQKVRSFAKECATHGTIFIFLITQSYSQLAYTKQNQSVFYTIQKDDTLSQILQALNLRPIYGKAGSLSRVLLCHQFKKNGNLIRRGDIIRLNYTIDPGITDHVQVLNGELTIEREWLKFQARAALRNQPTSDHNNFETLCLKSESGLAHSSRTLKPPSVFSDSDQKTIAFTKDMGTRSFFLVEATSALTRQDIRTNAGGYSELLSKSSPGWRLQWREDVSPNWDLDLSYAQHFISHTTPQGSVLSGDSSFTEFALGGLWNFKPSTTEDQSGWKMGPVLKYRTEPITARLNGSLIRLESPHMMVIGGNLENERALSPERALRLKTNISVWYAPQANQSDFVISNGYGLSADIRLLRPLGRQWDLSGGLSYGISRFQSSLGEHAGQQVIFGLGLIYRFGHNENEGLK